MNSNAAPNQISDEYINAVKNGKRRAYLENQMYTIYQSQRIRDQHKQIEESLPAPCSTNLLLAIVAFLILDAMLTLSILGFGSRSSLTIGNVLLQQDIATFFMAKSILTALFLGVFAVYKHYDFTKGISGRQFLAGTGIVYTALLGYLSVLVSAL